MKVSSPFWMQFLLTIPFLVLILLVSDLCLMGIVIFHNFLFGGEWLLKPFLFYIMLAFSSVYGILFVLMGWEMKWEEYAGIAMGIGIAFIFWIVALRIFGLI